MDDLEYVGGDELKTSPRIGASSRGGGGGGGCAPDLERGMYSPDNKGASVTVRDIKY